MKQEKIALTDDLRRTIETSMREGETLKGIAQGLGVHLDTLRRYLMKLGLANYASPRFQPPRPRPKNWHRPCLICKSKKPRPVGQFICSACKESRDETGLDPHFDYPDSL